MLQDDAIARSPLNPTHLVIALIGAALLVFGARFATDYLAGLTQAAPASPTISAPDNAASAPADSNDERIAAEARAARQQREQEFIERDRLLREQKKAEALRIRDEAAAQVQAAEAAKEAAWRRFYRPAPKCANPADDATRVDCSNQYIRARERFEKQYADGKLQ